MRLSLIAAIADNGTIGRAGGLPWHLPRDLKRFRRLTMGHHLIMGRKTFEAIGKRLPGRTSVVLTRGGFETGEGVLAAGSLDDAIEIARSGGDDEAFVIGGEQIFRLALPVVDRLYLTRVHAVAEGDTVFPPLDQDVWQITSSERHEAGEENSHPLTFQILERKSDRRNPRLPAGGGC